MITRYGLDVVRTVVVAAAVVAAGAFVLDAGAARIMLWGAAGLALAFTLYFFRDPERHVPAGADTPGNLVLAPGDGKVVRIVPVDHPPFLACPAIQVSVFLSPLNVHVNRIPVSGTVGYFRYVEGQYMVAFHEKASERNERTEIGIDAPAGRVLFRQIAGTVARRIVCTLRAGDAVRIGDRFGMIKFGSRVDVVVPATATVLVRMGDRVVGGETVMARL